MVHAEVSIVRMTQNVYVTVFGLCSISLNLVFTAIRWVTTHEWHREGEVIKMILQRYTFSTRDELEIKVDVPHVEKEKKNLWSLQ